MRVVRYFGIIKNTYWKQYFPYDKLINISDKTHISFIKFN